MKKLIISMVALVALVSTSCKKDDAEVVPTNKFMVNAQDFKGTIPAGDNVVLDPSLVYKLNGALIVEDGATLTLPAGTEIMATTPTEANPNVRYIAVAQGAKIMITGTKTAPVVLTAEKKESSAWGGLVICGKAPINTGGSAGATASAEVSELTYGGSNAADNSGIIQYLRIEYSGYKYSDTKEFNGLSLFGVGSGTVMDYVSSFKGGDDGIEFFGGTVVAKHLVSIDSEDDGLDFADGWNGMGEFWYVSNASKSGIEGSNNGNNGDVNYPMTNVTLKNLTIIGMGEKPWYLKEGAGKQTIDNVVIGKLKDGKKQAYFFTDATDNSANARITAGDIKITNVNFVDMGVDNTVKAVTGLSFTENTNATGAGNGKNAPDWAAGWSRPE